MNIGKAFLLSQPVLMRDNKHGGKPLLYYIEGKEKEALQLLESVGLISTSTYESPVIKK